MTPRGYATAVERGGWRIRLAGNGVLEESAADDAIGAALAAASGRAARLVRRSRRGVTWYAEFGATARREVFIKVLDAPTGIGALKRWFTGSRAAHLAAIVSSLLRDGFNAPAVLLYGAETGTGRELVMSERAPGVMLTRWMRECRGDLPRKRRMLRAVGAEVARLHHAGYIHGDLTPFNILAGPEDSPAIWFIDNERTRRTWQAHFERPRMRNLVQLGRFGVPGVTRTDMMRVWWGYSARLNPVLRRHRIRRLIRMLAARIARDGLESRTAPFATGGVKEG